MEANGTGRPLEESVTVPVTVIMSWPYDSTEARTADNVKKILCIFILSRSNTLSKIKQDDLQHQKE
jgi:hypothetical protein